MEIFWFKTNHWHNQHVFYQVGKFLTLLFLLAHNEYVVKNSTIIHKIFETNSSFHAKLHSMGKFYFLLFKSILLVLTKFSFWQKDWALGYHSMKFRDFPDLS